MVTLDDNGNIVVISKPADGTEWLLRMHAIIRLVQSVNEDMMDKEEIYHALSVLDDMLPNEDCAFMMWDLMKDKYKKE